MPGIESSKSLCSLRSGWSLMCWWIKLLRFVWFLRADKRCVLPEIAWRRRSSRPTEKRFSSATRISTSDSSRRTKACSSRSSGAGGCHAGRLLRQTKAGDQFGINLIGFGARQTGIGKSSTAAGLTTLTTNPASNRNRASGFAVSAGRFQAGVQITNLMRVEPSDELLKAVPGIGKDFMFSFAVWFN